MVLCFMLGFKFNEEEVNKVNEAKKIQKWVRKPKMMIFLDLTNSQITDMNNDIINTSHIVR